MQFDDILNATKAAQELVEKAHKEIELSGIQPVISLAALDAVTPLSMLCLPSDPSSVPALPSPHHQESSEDPQSSSQNQQLTGCLRSPSAAARKGLCTVSYKSQQLEQVMLEVCAEESSRGGSGSLSEPLSGSLSKPLSGSLDKGSSGSMTKPPSGAMSNGPSGSLPRSASHRTISPFAAAPLPPIPPRQ